MRGRERERGGLVSVAEQAMRVAQENARRLAKKMERGRERNVDGTQFVGEPQRVFIQGIKWSFLLSLYLQRHFKSRVGDPELLT